MTTRTLILTAFFLILIGSAYGQNTSEGELKSIVNGFIQTLRNEKVDTLCVYEDYYVGSDRTVKDTQDICLPLVYIPAYIIWVKEGKTFLSKRDNCFDYSTVTIAADSLWSYFFQFKEAMKTEEVKPFQFVYHQKGRKEIGLLAVDHSRYQDFVVYIGQDSVSKSFDSFDLEATREFGGEKKTNINGQHNQSLRSKQFVDQLNVLTRKVERNGLLTKSRR